MKSTYKLIGAMWDGVETGCFANIAPYDPAILDANTPSSLFDINGIRRKLPLTSLLKVRSVSELNAIAKRCIGCDEIYVERDYAPKYSSDVPNAFYTRRVRQILGTLSQLLGGIPVMLMHPYDKGHDAL